MTLSLPSNVYVVPFALAHSDCGWRSSSWVEKPLVVSVQRHEKNVRVTEEDLLCAVSMVNIPIKDTDALQAPLLLRAACSNCDIVKEAEP